MMFPSSARVEQCFTAFPQFVLPKITLRKRVTVKASVSFALEPQCGQTPTSMQPLNTDASCTLAFFRGGLQLLCLPHLRQEEKDVKYTFHLPHRVSLSLSLTAHQ